MTAYWCELAWLGGEAAEEGVVVEVEGERIVSVEAAAATPPADAVRLAGLTLPGLANAHSHAFHRALRGRVQRRGGSFWTWREDMYAVASRVDPDGYRRLARATFAEMALAGITAVGEFHYLHHGPGGEPYDNPNEIGEALIAAAGEAGIRITLLDTCYLHGGIGEELNEVQLRFADADADAWAARVDALRGAENARIGAAIHSVRGCDPDSAAVVAAWAAARECPLHAHVSEQPMENEACLAAYGASPTKVLEGAGALSERFTAVHATHVDDADIAALGSARCCCCFCPTTERDLADGIGPARALTEAGATLAPRLGLPRDHRSVRGGPRGRARRAARQRRARPPPRGGAAARRERQRARLDRLARGRLHRAGGDRRPGHGRRSTAFAWPEPIPTRRSRRRCLRPRPRTSTG